MDIGAVQERVGQLTAPTEYVSVDGDSFAYRRIGGHPAAMLPLVCLQHFRGNLDNWDPVLVDRLAEERMVVLVDNRGVAGSTGQVPDNVEDMTRDIRRFVSALGLTEVDVLGFSLGGFVAQELALTYPRLVRRLVLAGTAPRGAPRIHRWSDDVYELAAQDVMSPDHVLKLFFSGSDESQHKGVEYLKRISGRMADRDRVTDLATRDAQLTAITRWGVPDESQLERLRAVVQPALVACGDNDTMMQTPNSYLLATHLPQAQLRVYPDAGHGFLDQEPALFAAHVRAFLDGG
jgi:pimeloyl-ACP methyl ester carboxylesterase